MIKEKFLYELIDNWLYIVSRQCILIENYTQKDRTKAYMECSMVLAKCIEYFDKFSVKVDSGEYSQDEVDAKLEYIVQRLKQETIRKSVKEFNEHIGNYTKIDGLIEKYLCQKDDREVFSNNSLCCFMEEVRKNEMEIG